MKGILRGIEAARRKEPYKLVTKRFSVPWHGSRYDRAIPTAADIPNQAINCAATAVQAAAAIAITSLLALPQLGFIHEESRPRPVHDRKDSK